MPRCVFCMVIPSPDDCLSVSGAATLVLPTALRDQGHIQYSGMSDRWQFGHACATVALVTSAQANIHQLFTACPLA